MKIMKKILSNIFQKQQNSLIAGLRATNEALLKQELLNASMLGGAQADVVSGTSNGSLEKKEPSPECHDPLSIDHTKEATPSTSELNQLKKLKAI